MRLTRPIKDIERELHQVKSNLNLSKSGIKFLENRSLNELVICMPRYLNPSGATLKGTENEERDLAF